MNRQRNGYRFISSSEIIQLLICYNENMILKEFSKYLQENQDKSPALLLNEWIIERLKRPSLDKIDIVLKTELYYAENSSKNTLVIAKSETGRTLLNALYNFALSFEQYKFAKFLHNKKDSGFKKTDKTKADKM